MVKMKIKALHRKHTAKKEGERKREERVPMVPVLTKGVELEMKNRDNHRSHGRTQ